MGRVLARSLLLLAAAGGLLAAEPAGASGREASHRLVQGVTISCQTWGWEWGSDGFGAELDELAALGVNWVAIHPYARVHADGRVSHRDLDGDQPPGWLTRPIEEAHARGMALFVKPHLAYWGSPFTWRGEIEFEPEARARFFRDYRAWIVALARATHTADAFAVGTELDRLIAGGGAGGDERQWRELVRDVRAVTGARLTYAANWSDYDRIPFWDALDAIGVQAYFPLSDAAEPDAAELQAGWSRVLEPLRALSLRTGKPVVFTELGYDVSLDAARQPWLHHRGAGEDARDAERARALALQERCLEVALEVLGREHEWLRGAFLWKWFVGEPGWHDADFLVDTPEVRAVLARRWGG